MAIIYKITNLINNKMYIGQTTLPLGLRFKEHIYDSHKKDLSSRPLYKAFKKYGINNFKAEIIEECSLKDLSSRESYWISYYNTYHFGYNATSGGDGRPAKTVDDYLYYIKVYQQNNLTLKDTAKLLGCDWRTLKKALYLYDIPVNSPRNKPGSRYNSIKVSMYDLNNNHIKDFDTLSDAARFLGVNNPSHISACLNGKQKTYKGYKFKTNNCD